MTAGSSGLPRPRAAERNKYKAGVDTTPVFYYIIDMNRILDIFDNLDKTDDCKIASEHGFGIAGRFPDNRMDMNKLMVYTDLDRGNSFLKLCVGYLENGRQEWTNWYVGCQIRLTVWFEDGTRVDFERSSYETKIEYKWAVYNYFREYIANGFDNGSRLRIAQEVEFMDI